MRCLFYLREMLAALSRIYTASLSSRGSLILARAMV
jgi:hypothetical protein